MILEQKMDVMFSGIWLWFKSLNQNLDDRMIPASCGEGMYWCSIALLINSLLCIGSDHYDFVDMPSSSDHVVVLPKKLLSHLNEGLLNCTDLRWVVYTNFSKNCFDGQWCLHFGHIFAYRFWSTLRTKCLCWMSRKWSPWFQIKIATWFIYLPPNLFSYLSESIFIFPAQS